MGEFYLNSDEVIILEESSVRYSGSVEGLGRVEKLILTNKRIAWTWRNKRKDEFQAIFPNEIKKYYGVMQVDCFEKSTLGQCLRIQSVNGVELFALGEKHETLKDVFKEMLSVNIKENKFISLWISKINEVFNSTNEINSNENTNEIIQQTRNTKNIEKIQEIYTPSENDSTYEEKSNESKIVEVEKIVEVIKCRKCGSKISPNTKFCPECGTQVIEPVKPKFVSTVGENIENKVLKCPACGEILSSSAINCPSCGYEVRGKQTPLNVQTFFVNISKINDDKRKIEAIKMYAIPNTKEDIMEFMILSTSVFDPKLYVTDEQGETVATAWHAKIEQCYKKAMLMFTDEDDIKKVEKLYNEIQGKTKSAKKTKLTLTIVGTALIILGLFAVGVSPKTTNPDGVTQSPTYLSYLSTGIVVVGIILVVVGRKKKRTNKKQK